MKKMKSIFFILILSFLILPGVSRSVVSSTPEIKGQGIFYVHARGGLVLRKSPNPNGEVLQVLKPGTKVQVIGLTDQKMTFRGWRGHWASVRVDDGLLTSQKGYVFSAFLSTIPFPERPRSLKAYAEFLWENEIAARYESFRDDNIGHVMAGESIALELSSAQEAFLIGRNLLKIPGTFDYPPSNPKAKGYEQMVNPDKEKESWSDQLDIERDGQGNIIKFYYYKRWEGAGEAAVVEKDDGRWKLEYYFIAD